MLRVDGLAKRFDDVAVLDGVDLHADAGEFVALVGPSGCGKSTLLRVLAGLVRCDAGRVVLDGDERAQLLGRVGYMPQKDLLLPWRSVLDNVTLGLELGGVARAAARERARAELGRFGLAGFEDRWPASLSGGMRQRAALLRTFLAGRELLLLDEPFAGLDALTRELMGEWLLGVWGADRKTILFVTHDVGEAVYLADRVYVMSGRPARIELCAEVALGRPRRLDIMRTPEFGALRERLLVPLRAAARAQLGPAA